MKNHMYKCTFVVLFDNVEDVCKFRPCRNGVQYIVLDRSDKDSDVAKLERKIRYFKSKGIEYLSFEPDDSIAYCYNNSIDYIKGEYVCFTDQHFRYNYTAFKALDIATRQNNKPNLVSINYKKPYYLDITRYIHDYSMTVSEQNDRQTLITLLNAVFVRTDFIGDIRFNDVCEEESASMFLVSLWQKDSTTVTFENIYCYYKGVSFKSDAYYGCRNKDFYIKSLQENFIPLINCYISTGQVIPDWMLRFVYYRIYFKFYSNFDFRDKCLICDDEIQQFFDLSSEILKHIPDELIFSNEEPEQYSPRLSLRNFFLYLKHNGDLEKLNRSFSIEDEQLYFNQCGCRYNFGVHNNFMVRAFNIRNNMLSIDLKVFTHMLYDYVPDCVSVLLNGKSYEVVKNDIYTLGKVFAVPIHKAYTFSVDLPIDEVLKDGSQIEFYLEIDGVKKLMELDFNRPPSKLNVHCRDSYWRITDEYTLVYENKKLVVRKFSDGQLRLREIRFYFQSIWALLSFNVRLISKANDMRNYLPLRPLYFMTKRRYKGRRIWLYFDKLYKAGDNGEYAFKHAMTRDDGIEHYYIINRDSLDYPRLKALYPKNILVYNSIKCRLHALNAENIVATHPDIIEFLGINPRVATVVKDIFSANLICIAHGITIQKNADYQNRLYDNTMFYTTSSKYEVNHILKPAYNYREDEVALTGLARFDGLKNNDQKQILITPTWRRNIVGGAKRNSTRNYSDEFKKTSYYKIYNSLINDSRIIDVAKQTGYKVIFLLHPAMSTQIDDYDRNDYVELIQASGDLNYEKILTESSLMITDYSGIHYDFGYMRKPIIYYQPKEVPMRFEEGGMKFATMAFGPVCTEYEDAVKLICEYMQNQCKMPDEYKKRADDFFAFDDFNSSQRIYDAILKWTEQKKNYETKIN